MAEATVTLINPLGLHARAAAKIVQVANEHSSAVVVACPNTNKSSDGRSLLSLLELGAKNGSTLLIQVEGHDAEIALEAMVELVKDGFGEL